MSFNALWVTKDEEGQTAATVKEITLEQLPQNAVIVAVEYSSLNYKDGLCLGSGGGLVRNYPHIPGIDLAGTVFRSEDARYSEGDRVLLTGWQVGERYFGGYAQYASVNPDFLVPIPDDLSSFDAMSIGTAGLSAMLGVNALESQGLKPDQGPVLVTGAAGGVGSVATAMLHQLGYEVAAVTGRPQHAEALKQLGATQIVAREDINTTVKRPLESETWAGCIDAVGGEMLARVLGQLKYGASVAAIGLAGGVQVPASVIPFLLRGVNIFGIDSVMQPYEKRVQAWQRAASDLPLEKLRDMTTTVSLDQLPALGEQILAGQVKGRVVVDVNALDQAQSCAAAMAT